jgi:hypothetical protein
MYVYIPHRPCNFKKEVGLGKTQVFKGGSMGQGTAVPRHYDIDLVLYSETWREKVERKIDEQKRKGLGKTNQCKKDLSSN